MLFLKNKNCMNWLFISLGSEGLSRGAGGIMLIADCVQHSAAGACSSARTSEGALWVP